MNFFNQFGAWHYLSPFTFIIMKKQAGFSWEFHLLCSMKLWFGITCAWVNDDRLVKYCFRTFVQGNLSYLIGNKTPELQVSMRHAWKERQNNIAWEEESCSLCLSSQRNLVNWHSILFFSGRCSNTHISVLKCWWSHLETGHTPGH